MVSEQQEAVVEEPTYLRASGWNMRLKPWPRYAVELYTEKAPSDAPEGSKLKARAPPESRSMCNRKKKAGMCSKMTFECCSASSSTKYGNTCVCGTNATIERLVSVGGMAMSHSAVPRAPLPS